MDFIRLHLGGDLEVVLFGELGFGLFQELGQNGFAGRGGDEIVAVLERVC